MCFPAGAFMSFHAANPAAVKALFTIPFEEYVTNTPPFLVWAATLGEYFFGLHNSGCARGSKAS